MDKGSFNKLLRRTVAIPVVLLVVLAAVLVGEILSLTSALRWIAHTDQVISEARQLGRSMVDMETGLRGYYLTGDASFLGPYYEASARLADRLSSLRRLTSDNPDQQRRLGELSDLDFRWKQWADAQLAKRGASSPSAGEIQAGQQLMTKVRARQYDLINTEEQLRTLRTHRASVLNAMVMSSALVLLVVTMIVLFTLTRGELVALSSTYERHLRAEAEKARQLQESQELLQITLRSFGDAVISTDAAGTVSYLNPAAEELTGWRLQEAAGQPLQTVLHLIDERTRNEISDPAAQVQRNQSVVVLSSYAALISRAGEEYPVEMTGAPILDDHQQLVGAVMIFRDITQRRQTEQTLRASERLAMAGRLSATIAHEIRNPLDTVCNLVYLLQHEGRTTASQDKYLELASEELARISQITGQLLTFHREARAPLEVNLVEVLQSVLVLFAPQVTRCHVEIEERFEPVRPVRGFPGELRQVFSNLVGNGVDAMPNGGKLILHVRESSLANDPARKGVRVTVLDSGTGIPAGVRKNLFAPFFTTKGERGTGLGLWVSRGIVEKHEGTIQIISSIRPGKSGTAFSVFLPFEQKLGMLDIPTGMP